MRQVNYGPAAHFHVDGIVCSRSGTNRLITQTYSGNHVKLTDMSNNGHNTQLSSCIFTYLGCNSLAEAGAIEDEAHAGNPAAQYITAMALSRENRVASEEWMAKSAAQGFKPALIKVRRRSARAEHSSKIG